MKQQKMQCWVLLGDPAQPDRVKLNGKFNREDMETINRLKEALVELSDYEFFYLDDHKKMLEKLLQERPQFVFNLCDEGFNNDPFKELHLPAFLEMLGIPYTGAGPDCLSICYNKELVAAGAKKMGVATPEEICVDTKHDLGAISAQFPVLAKPVCGDSSIGITKEALIHTNQQLVNYCNWLRSTLPYTPILIQEYLSGKEYSVALIGNGDKLTLLPILEVDFSALPEGLPPILGYESKWDPESPYFTKVAYIQADLTDEQTKELFETSSLLFQRLGCRDYARFDFRADSNGKIKVLEVNPNPGWCWDGKLNLMAAFAGWSYPKLLQEILNAARERTEI